MHAYLKPAWRRPKGIIHPVRDPDLSICSNPDADVGMHAYLKPAGDVQMELYIRSGIRI
jgi:hypothetical protein